VLGNCFQWRQNRCQLGLFIGPQDLVTKSIVETLETQPFATETHMQLYLSETL
jgi:hypothetical protein